MVRVIQSPGGFGKGRVAELPLRRRLMPDKFRKVVGVLPVTGLPTRSGKIELIPPRQLSLRRQRFFANLLTADQIPAHRDQGFHPLRPQRGDDIRRARAPVKTGQIRLPDVKGVHQMDNIGRHRRRLTVTRRAGGEETGRAVATQIRHDHPVTLLR